MRALTRRGRLTVSLLILTALACYLLLRNVHSFSQAFAITLAALVIVYALPLATAPAARKRRRSGSGVRVGEGREW